MTSGAASGCRCTIAPVPVWNPATGTCASTYCHGSTQLGGAHKVPVWTQVDGTQKTCGSCHGDPPPAPRLSLAHSDWPEVGRQLRLEWDNRKRLASGVTTPVIDELIARATAAGATAAKVCGAGGGGCLFCYGPPDRGDAIRDALAAGGARLLDYRVERHGLTRG